MRLKQTIPALAVLLCFGAMPRGESQAAPRDDDARARGARERDPQIIIRSDEEKQKRLKAGKVRSDNSNRQSDPDSTRGLERAEERRPVHAGNDTDNTDDGWYEYLFGKRQDVETKSERGWYEHLFGSSSTESRKEKKEKDKDKEKDKEDDDSNWWWPFD